MCYFLLRWRDAYNKEVAEDEQKVNKIKISSVVEKSLKNTHTHTGNVENFINNYILTYSIEQSPS